MAGGFADSNDDAHKPTFTKEQVAFSLSRFQNRDADDENYCLQLIDTFLNSVFLYDDNKLVLTLNYSGGRSKITLSIMEKAVFHGGAECSAFAPPTAARRGAPNAIGSYFCARI